MSTDPFIAPRAANAPRHAQQLPEGVAVPASRPWHVGRPGDDMDVQRSAGSLRGNPGPNVGYALTLVARLAPSFTLTAGEHLHDAEAVVAAVAMKRAASFGRAPMIDDVRIAGELLGYLDAAPADFVAWRLGAVHDAGHSYPARRALVDGVDEDFLHQPSAAVREGIALARHQLQFGWPRVDH